MNRIVEQLRVDRRSLDIYAVPPLPRLTPEESKRNPELAQFVGRLGTTWEHLGATIKDRLLALTDFKDTQAAIDLLAAQLKALQDSLKSQQAQGVVILEGFNSQLVAMNEQIQEILNMITTINNLLTQLFQQGFGSQMFLFPVDASTWTATHAFERRVSVELFNESWERFESFVEQPDSATVIARLVPAGRGAMIVS